MSKQRARRPESYLRERFLLELTPELLRAKGFESVRVEKRGQMKFLTGMSATGTPVAFWLKQGWSTTRLYSAVQFGMIAEQPAPGADPDSVFVDQVEATVASAKLHGAGYVLMVHMFEDEIRDYTVLRIGDVVTAYRRQLRRWPERVRQAKIPALYFVDARPHPHADSVEVVADLNLPLEVISGAGAGRPSGESPGSGKITSEVARRLNQQAFRVRVGERHGWKCGVTGTSVREVLKAAHYPDQRHWVAEETGDGMLLRADLHRLLECGIAEITDGTFVIVDPKRAGEYVTFHGHPVRS